MAATEEETLASMGMQLLVETLQPFASMHVAGIHDDFVLVDGPVPALTMGDCRRAAETLALLLRVEDNRG